MPGGRGIETSRLLASGKSARRPNGPPGKKHCGHTPYNVPLCELCVVVMLSLWSHCQLVAVGMSTPRVGHVTKTGSALGAVSGQLIAVPGSSVSRSGVAVPGQPVLHDKSPFTRFFPACLLSIIYCRSDVVVSQADEFQNCQSLVA